MDDYFVTTENVTPEVVRLRFGDKSNGRLLSRSEVHTLWKSSEAFCAVFSETLAAVRMDAYFWETPVLLTNTLETPFECVLKSSPALARQAADPQPFATQFSTEPSISPVISFGNLSGDADLIVPQPIDDTTDYAHLARFLRTATGNQTRAMWSLMAQITERWLARGQPCWLSTSGLGVAWLHIRLDARPKYYSYAPYRAA